MAERDVRIAPFFLNCARGPLFCMYLAPAHGDIVGAVLYLHPFAEEMHKSRRMAALQARQFAARGYAVLQVDLTGCGDSMGDFGDATWSAWREDALLAGQWLVDTTDRPVAIWGLRTGGLLAVDIADDLPVVERLVLWQPVTNGELFLNQFLRIKLAGEMLLNRKTQTSMARMRGMLAEGKAVEVAGYLLSATMAKELALTRFPSSPPGCPVLWLEAGHETDGELKPDSKALIEAWSTAGGVVDSRAAEASAFWNAQEITESPGFITATLEGMGL